MRSGVVIVLAVAAMVTVAPGSQGATEALRLVPVVRGLDAPVYVTSAPGEPGRLYVVEQGGTIRVVENGRVRSQPFLDISSRVRSGGEQGLLGLAFFPDYERSRFFVVNYTDNDGNTRVVRFRANSTTAAPSSARQLLFVRQPYPNHNGGMVTFGPDGRLYVGMGDGGAGGDPENRAQNMRSLLGKLIRLDVREPGSRGTIVALGLRNPWRFSFDRKTGDLVIADVGQNAFEEIDWVKWPLRGLLNFGWDVYEARAPFENKPLGPGKLVQPIAQYGRSGGCSVTGGYIYRGSAVPAAAGRYFYGDYCSGNVWSLRVVGGKARQLRREPFEVAGLASFGEDAAGELYLVAHGGTIYRLAPG